ncbi:MAG: hypothetical protein H3C62_10140 [Gemmatimonadaceae bacterium]|nr:hypothetical protein [Gemmatimonadaceae bacterium]
MSKLFALMAGTVGGLFVGALLVTLVDLYLAGHNVTPLGSRRLLHVDAVGVHLSLADGLALLSAMAGGALGWFTRERSP